MGSSPAHQTRRASEGPRWRVRLVQQGPSLARRVSVAESRTVWLDLAFTFVIMKVDGVNLSLHLPGRCRGGSNQDENAQLVAVQRDNATQDGAVQTILLGYTVCYSNAQP